MNTNHHLSKPAMIGKLECFRNVRCGLALDQPDQGFGLEQISSRERQADCRLDVPMGLRRMHRADFQGLVITPATVTAPIGLVLTVVFRWASRALRIIPGAKKAL